MVPKSTLILLITITMIMACSVMAQTKVFKFVDSQGRVQFTDRPKHDGYIQLFKTWKGWTPAKVSPNYRINKQKYSAIISATAKQYDLSADLLMAIIHAESHFNPQSVSNSGAVGLMQLMPATARRFKVNDRQNPNQNIRGGAEYLNLLMTLFDDNLDLTLAAYNAGENAVKRYGNKIPPYNETQNYVKKVRDLYSKYQQNKL